MSNFAALCFDLDDATCHAEDDGANDGDGAAASPRRLAVDAATALIKGLTADLSFFAGETIEATITWHVTVAVTTLRACLKSTFPALLRQAGRAVWGQRSGHVEFFKF